MSELNYEMVKAIIRQSEATIRQAAAVEKIANLLEGRESGVRVAQLDKIQGLYDQWGRSSRPDVIAEEFMCHIGDVLRGEDA